MLKLVSGSYISLLSWPMQTYSGVECRKGTAMSCLGDQSSKRNLTPLSTPPSPVILHFKELVNI